MCAIAAGARGNRVALLDHNTQVGAKILISGGGRCNITKRHIAAELPPENPHLPQRLEPPYASLPSCPNGWYNIAWHEKPSANFSVMVRPGRLRHAAGGMRQHRFSEA
jgi:predicted flavoprotein YhiN